ncbi:hypothetical protein CVIRNUC_000068 [Coccomyxa viridis]|uniref:BZIP domain-containing protein n=1 Tax=Coccomyxa viridis TaxID=1274662 RepID=A0AAV1HS33_9CHLO|nr:hypothetical protein CVIRNUC_000068 [Coccomyxa viridis]
MPPDIPLKGPSLDTPADTPPVAQERVTGYRQATRSPREAGGAKPEIQRRDGASPRSRVGAASGPAPGMSGSSGGSDNPSRDSPELSGRKRRVPEPALASMRHQEERRRQQRLAKTRATAAASRERKRLETEQMSARAGALQQQNAHLKELLAHRNQEKHLLAREVDAIRHDQGEASLPGGVRVPSAGGDCRLPQTDASRQQPPPQLAEKPPLPGHSRALRSSQAGCASVPLHGSLSPFKRAAFGSMLEGGLPGHELQRSQSRPGAAADSSSGGSQATRVGSMPGQMSALTGSPGHWADRAGQLPGAERQDSQLSDRLLPELDALLEADGCPELPGPGAPGPAHGLLLPPASALQHPLSGPLGPGGVTDGWADDKEADLALFSEIGQPMIRKGLKSLPPGFQAPRQLGISREGSTSLPAHLTRSAVVPCSESPAPSPAPGPSMPSGPGIIVGVGGQWLRLKAGIPVPPAMRQRLGQPSAPSMPGTLPSWP